MKIVITGVVKSFKDDTLIAGALVTIGGITAKTDEDGFYRIELSKPGRYTVHVEAAVFKELGAEMDFLSSQIFNIALISSATPTPTNTPTITPILTSTPTPAIDRSDIIRTINPETGMEEMLIPLPGLPEDAVQLEMVLIPAGTFMMGSPEDERGRVSYKEWLPHQVTISKPFYIGKYELTKAQDAAIQEDSRYMSRLRTQNELNLPINGINWYTSLWICNQLNVSMGYAPAYNEETEEVNWNADGFRLPTEAEWEYACRAGTTTRFWFGDALECEDTGPPVCDFVFDFLRMKWDPTGSFEQEVGMKIPNPWGLYNMHGNLSEWCMDWQEWYSSKFVIVKGGSNRSKNLMTCRSAYRNLIDPNTVFNPQVDIGLRIVKPYP